MTAGEQSRYEARMEALAEANYKIVKGALKLGMDSQTIARIKEEN